MTQPAVWNDDPACGHDVACAFQTHYCTYIRVPRLLTLAEEPPTSDALLLTTVSQWYELWFKVLVSDLRAALMSLESGSPPSETLKLLRRGIELFRLLDGMADLAETVVVRQASLTKRLRLPPRGVAAASEQFLQLESLSRKLLRRVSLAGVDGQRADAIQEYSARLKAFRFRHRKFLDATLIHGDPASPMYSAWLCLPALLDLQEGVKAAWTEPGRQPAALMKPERIGPDELMFIVVHQCFEIWFKVLLGLIDRIVPALLDGKVDEAARLTRWVVLVQRLLVHQIQIPATMLPLDFMRFRSQTVEHDGKVFKTGLSPASGTESYQFREIEIVSGLRDDPVFRKYLAGTDRLPIRLLTPRQAERLEETSLPEAFRTAVRRRGIERYDDLFTPADVPNPHADLAQLADALIEFDEFFRLWRFGHVSMVEKMIGAKSGTGFLGPEYLMETAGIRVQEKNRVFEERQLRPRFFEELWAVRTRMGAY